MLGSQSVHHRTIKAGKDAVLALCGRRSQPVSRADIFSASPITFSVSKVPDFGVVECTPSQLEKSHLNRHTGKLQRPKYSLKFDKEKLSTAKIDKSQ